MTGTISCADFLLALKRYREEVGAPQLTDNRIASAGEQSRAASEERKPSESTLIPSPAKRIRKTDKLKEKELRQRAAEKQGALW